MASHGPLSSEGPGLGGCDVTGRILNSKKKERGHFMSVMMKYDIHV